MYLRKLFLVSGMAVSLMSCLEPSPLPVGGPIRNDAAAVGNSVILALPRAALANLAELADKLLISVNRSENGALGDLVGEPYVFTISEAGVYTISGVPLGELVFTIKLQDKAGTDLAEGSVQANIGLGAQTLPQVVLKPLVSSTGDLRLKLALNLTNFPGAKAEAPSEPAAVRALFVAYGCASCHSAARPRGGLNLQDFPYKLTGVDSLESIVALVADSLTGSNGVTKMPPSSKTATPAEVATVQDFLRQIQGAGSSPSPVTWVQEVKLKFDVGGPSEFQGELVLVDGTYQLPSPVKVELGKRYAYSLEVEGPSGSKLLKVEDASVDVPLTGQVDLSFSIDYQEPRVSIPVSVGRAAN